MKEDVKRVHKNGKKRGLINSLSLVRRKIQPQTCVGHILYMVYHRDMICLHVKGGLGPDNALRNDDSIKDPADHFHLFTLTPQLCTCHQRVYVSPACVRVTSVCTCHRETGWMRCRSVWRISAEPPLLRDPNKTRREVRRGERRGGGRGVFLMIYHL